MMVFPTSMRFWHPAGVRGNRRVCPGVSPAFAGSTPGYVLAPLRGGKDQAEPVLVRHHPVRYRPQIRESPPPESLHRRKSIWRTLSLESILASSSAIVETMSPHFDCGVNCRTLTGELLIPTTLCQALVRYALAGMDQQLFVSQYQMQLPEARELETFLQRELQEWKGSRP